MRVQQIMVVFLQLNIQLETSKYSKYSDIPLRTSQNPEIAKLRFGTVFAQYQDKNCITSRDLFKTSSGITAVQDLTKYADNVYHRQQNL